jgi:hypothetical protein
VALQGEAMPDVSGTQPASGPGAVAAPLFLRLLTASVSAALVGLFFTVGPAARPSAETSPAAIPPEHVSPAPSPAGPRAGRVVALYEGPSTEYPVLATLPRGARVEVVGRSADGEWLALSVAPGSPLYGWAPRTSIIDAPAASSLPLKPIVPIEAP